MKSVTIQLTAEQYCRLTAAAEFVGQDATVEELIIANALSRLDGHARRPREVQCDLQHGVHTYARQKLAAAIDLSEHEVNVGVEVCDHELGRLHPAAAFARSQAREVCAAFASVYAKHIEADRIDEARAEFRELAISRGWEWPAETT